jgi:phosphoglycolate phosphatase-like HAD superfamily hydrolase
MTKIEEVIRSEAQQAAAGVALGVVTGAIQDGAQGALEEGANALFEEGVKCAVEVACAVCCTIQ